MPVVARDSFCLPKRPDRFWWPRSLICDRYQGYTTMVRRPERKVNHLPTSSDEVNEWSRTSTPLQCNKAWDEDNFFFLLRFNRRSEQFVWNTKRISRCLNDKAGGMNERRQCPHHRPAQCDTAHSAASGPLVESQRQNTCRIMTVYYDHTVIKQTCLCR